METNVIHSCGRTELALAYFPQSWPQTAWRRLKRWIYGCPQLVADLKKLGYNPRRRQFTAAEIKAIISRLGEP